MKDDAKAVTEAFGGDGNVWSDVRVNKREAITLIKVATFSGASSNARRTEHIRGSKHVTCELQSVVPSFGVTRE